MKQAERKFAQRFKKRKLDQELRADRNFGISRCDLRSGGRDSWFFSVYRIKTGKKHILLAYLCRFLLMSQENSSCDIKSLRLDAQLAERKQLLRSLPARKNAFFPQD